MVVSGIHAAVTGNQLVPGYDGLGIALFGGAMLAAAVWQQVGKVAHPDRPSSSATDVLILIQPVRKRMVMAALFVIVAVASYRLFRSSPDRLLFQAAFVVFGVMALVAMLAVGQRVSLTLTREGLDYSPFRVGLISWRDIRGVQIKRLRYFDTITLDVVAPESYRSRHILRRIFGARFDVSPTIFGQDTEWVASEIKKRIVAFGPRSRPSPAPTSSHDTLTEAS